MDEDDEDDDDGDSEQWDRKPLLDSPKYTLDSPKSEFRVSDHSTSQNTPDTSWSTSTSNDSNASSLMTSPTNLTSNSLNSRSSNVVESTTISTTNSLLDPMLNNHQGSFNSTLKNLTTCTVTEPKLSCNNNNEDLMKDFTEFVDLVDSLHGMPEIDFEDNFEMFPC